MDLLRIIIAILLPPLGVFLQVGIGKQFWINILLTILGYIPGIVHAVWVPREKRAVPGRSVALKAPAASTTRRPITHGLPANVSKIRMPMETSKPAITGGR